jgi:hypothetical protein
MRRAIAAGSLGKFCDAAKSAWRGGATSGKLERDGQSVLAKFITSRRAVSASLCARRLSPYQQWRSGSHVVSGLAMKRGPSVDFCGYWQHHKAP